MKPFSVLSLGLLFLFLNPTFTCGQVSAETNTTEWLEGGGLQAEYYNGTHFQQKVLSRIDEEINFQFLGESPAPGVRSEYYSIRWTGSVYAPITGTYKLSVRVDDGVRVWLNDNIILDKWQLQEATTYSGQVQLTAGEFYSLKIEYYNGPLHGVMRLLWEMPQDAISSFFSGSGRTTREAIPQRYLFAKVPAKNKPLIGHTGLNKKVKAIAAKPSPSRPTSSQPGGTSIPTPITKDHLVEKKGSDHAVEQKQALAEKQPNVHKPLAGNVYEKLKAGETVQLKNVLFEQGKYVLLEGSYAELDKLAKSLLKNPNVTIRIEGHTDNVGNPRHNLSLSFFRAKVVATYLVEQGIDARRIEVKGLGSSRPLADNGTEEGRARNRRVEFVVQ